MTHKRKTTYILAATGIGLLVATYSANAALIYDANVTPNVIMGSGITNGSFTVDQANGVELGLRGKLRFNGSGLPENTFNSNSDGTYSFAAGVAPTKSSPTAVWSFEWSINSNYNNSGGVLNSLSYALGIDSDPTLGTNYLVFDPINGVNPSGYILWDHDIGTNVTGTGGGIEFTTVLAYAAGIAANNVAQNSWQAHWFISPFDPTVDGQYDFYLAAFNGSTQLARTNMSIIVGQGASVPEPGTVALLALGLAGFGFGRFRLRQKKRMS